MTAAAPVADPGMAGTRIAGGPAIGPRRVTDPAGFGRVAVLMGGESAEREISLLTGTAVHQALVDQGVDAVAIDAVGDLVGKLGSGRFDRVFIALHGRGGEDGTLQGLLEFLGLPYTGSGVLGSAVGMDKLRTKRLLHGAGLPTARYAVLRDEADLAEAVAQLGLPLMVKPATEGSSIGMSRVDSAEQLPAAWQLAGGYGCEVLAEEWIAGPEYTVAILAGQALPVIRIEAQGVFYDYHAKYTSDETRYVCPAGLPPGEERALAELALAAFAAVGCRGWGRVDLMLHPVAGPMILELNTVPGMTSHSLVPMAAAAAGIGFAELVWRILETSLPMPPAGSRP
jgi:D-alanine-D-alanine ligase